MRISVGILAWNEAQSIGHTIESLFDQTLLKNDQANVESIELVVVPNGCTDATAAVAVESFHRNQSTGRGSKATCRVCEVGIPGKANAWNEFVHRFSDQSSDYMILMDADVVLESPMTLESMILTLQADLDASVSTPERKKDIAGKPKRGLRDRLSLGASEIGQSRPAMLAGCLYCGRGEVLRRIWLPTGLLGEDAFLCAMVVTDCFTHDTKVARVIKAPNAAVVFEAYTRIGDVWYNLRRRAITRGIDAIIYSYLWANVGTTVTDAGELIRLNNSSNPEWVRSLVREHVVKHRWWIMPRGVILVRLTTLFNLPWHRRLALFPVAVLAMIVETLVHISANAAIRNDCFSGSWRSKAVAHCKAS